MQPPSGGCVLKPRVNEIFDELKMQPPSGGCVLKQKDVWRVVMFILAAAFGRLCVETKSRSI